MNDDTGTFYAIGFKHTAGRYLRSVRTDNRGIDHINWTDERYAAKVWRTKEAAERNANQIFGGVVVKVFR
jgi:hypothetical protein